VLLRSRARRVSTAGPAKAPPRARGAATFGRGESSPAAVDSLKAAARPVPVDGFYYGAVAQPASTSKASSDANIGGLGVASASACSDSARAMVQIDVKETGFSCRCPRKGRSWCSFGVPRVSEAGARAEPSRVKLAPPPLPPTPTDPDRLHMRHVTMQLKLAIPFESMRRTT